MTRRRRRPPQAPRAERGYGQAHVRERARWAPVVDSGTATCTRCGYGIDPEAPWQLDHRDDRRGWLGPAHSACNLSAGGRKAHRLPPKTSAGRAEAVTVSYEPAIHRPSS
jgi:hypothetical protein